MSANSQVEMACFSGVSILKLKPQMRKLFYEKQAIAKKANKDYDRSTICSEFNL